MTTDLYFYCLYLFLAAFGGGLITLLRAWSEDVLHGMLSFSAGIFLGTVFLHLLPEAMELGPSDQVGFWIMLGFLLLFVLERFLLARSGPGSVHSHMVISLTALIGLSVHSVISGFGLGVAMADPILSQILFWSIIIHKLPAAFSLGSLMSLAKHSRMQIVINLFLFSIMTPLGALVLFPVIEASGENTMMILTGVVTGTFLYVSTSAMLPEAFHSGRHRWLHLVLLILGLSVMVFLSGGELQHTHG